MKKSLVRILSAIITITVVLSVMPFAFQASAASLTNGTYVCSFRAIATIKEDGSSMPVDVKLKITVNSGRVSAVEVEKIVNTLTPPAWSEGNHANVTWNQGDSGLNVTVSTTDQYLWFWWTDGIGVGQFRGSLQEETVYISYSSSSLIKIS